MSLHHKVAQVALRDAYGEISRLLGTLDEPDLMRPTRCAGWVVSDVLFHLLTDAQRALVSLSGRTTGTPESDWLTYWRRHDTLRSTDQDRRRARYVRLGAAAYADPWKVCEHWRETADAVSQAVEYAPGARTVRFQGTSLSVTDLFAVVAVEATVHHLDMLAELEGKPPPREGATGLAVRTLDGLLGRIDRPDWDDRTTVLKLTGRTPLSVSERRFLDERGFRIPLIG